jgi:hypothetical protein
MRCAVVDAMRMEDEQDGLGLLWTGEESASQTRANPAVQRVHGTYGMASAKDVSPRRTGPG